MDSTGPGVDTSQSVKLLRERDRGGLVFLFFFSFFLFCFVYSWLNVSSMKPNKRARECLHCG